jgi:hypothetical protein
VVPRPTELENQIGGARVIRKAVVFTFHLPRKGTGRRKEAFGNYNLTRGFSYV